MKTSTLGISLVAALAVPIVLAANHGAAEKPATAHLKPRVASVTGDGPLIANPENEDIVRKIKIYPLI